jgi:hypothetical protein
MGVSIRAYARHRGMADNAVRKAIKAGRITPEAMDQLILPRPMRPGKPIPITPNGMIRQDSGY